MSGHACVLDRASPESHGAACGWRAYPRLDDDSAQPLGASDRARAIAFGRFSESAPTSTVIASEAAIHAVLSSSPALHGLPRRCAPRNDAGRHRWSRTVHMRWPLPIHPRTLDPIGILLHAVLDSPSLGRTFSKPIVLVVIPFYSSFNFISLSFTCGRRGAGTRRLSGVLSFYFRPIRFADGLDLYCSRRPAAFGDP